MRGEEEKPILANGHMIIWLAWRPHRKVKGGVESELRGQNPGHHAVCMQLPRKPYPIEPPQHRNAAFQKLRIWDDKGTGSVINASWNVMEVRTSCRLGVMQDRT